MSGYWDHYKDGMFVLGDEEVDKESLKKSSSGGFFYEIAINFVKDGGYVAGCIWNQDMMPVHILSNKLIKSLL